MWCNRQSNPRLAGVFHAPLATTGSAQKSVISGHLTATEAARRGGGGFRAARRGTNAVSRVTRAAERGVGEVPSGAYRGWPSWPYGSYQDETHSARFCRRRY